MAHVLGVHELQRVQELPEEVSGEDVLKPSSQSPGALALAVPQGALVLISPADCRYERWVE